MVMEAFVRYMTFVKHKIHPNKSHVDTTWFTEKSRNSEKNPSQSRARVFWTPIPLREKTNWFYALLFWTSGTNPSRTVFPNLKKSSHTLLSSYSRKVKWEVARELSSWAVHHRTDGCRGICWPSLGYLHLTWVPSKILRLRCSEFPIDAMAFTPVIPTLPMTLQYNLNHWDDQALMEQRQGYWMSHASKML